MLLPGFHDSHIHVVQGSLGLASCDLSMDANADAVAKHIAACARDNPHAGWVIGHGWQLGVFANANPTRSQLDAIVAECRERCAGTTPLAPEVLTPLVIGLDRARFQVHVQGLLYFLNWCKWETVRKAVVPFRYWRFSWTAAEHSESGEEEQRDIITAGDCSR